ncbi:NYN domain-containing protein [Planctomycetota bacterium]
MARCSFYIDGFNVYYSINTHQFKRYKWLNYYAIAKDFTRRDDTIARVAYFTTYVTWKPGSVARHKEYVKALRFAGVEIILGRFLKKSVTCHNCHRPFKTREEKQTDVNIALHLLSDAVNDYFDRAIIISGDTDLVPAIEMVHKHCPEKEIGVVFPIRRINNSLLKAADFYRTLRMPILKRCQLPDEIKIGNVVIRRPQEWR